MKSGPQNLTVIKLSADAAEICWRFPLSAAAEGYVLRYWRHPASLDDDSTIAMAPQELKIADVDNTAANNAVNNTRFRERRVYTLMNRGASGIS